jgi:hypothetical protein
LAWRIGTPLDTKMKFVKLSDKEYDADVAGWRVCALQVNDGIIDVCHGGRKGLIWPLPLAR